MNCQDIRDLVNRMNDERSPYAVEAQQMLTRCANTFQQLQNLERVWRSRDIWREDNNWELAADELNALIRGK